MWVAFQFRLYNSQTAIMQLKLLFNLLIRNSLLCQTFLIFTLPVFYTELALQGIRVSRTRRKFSESEAKFLLIFLVLQVVCFAQRKFILLGLGFICVQSRLNTLNTRKFSDMGDCFGVLFPSGSLPSVFGSWAFTKGHRVSLYSPDGIPKYIFTDLSVQAIERFDSEMSQITL